MQKSKSWLKSLLIVVMAVVLVFSLVACNKDNGPKDGTPVRETSAEYFTALWNSTSSIGADTIANNADLAIGFGVEISIDTFNEVLNEVHQQIDLGLDVQAVVGRTEATAGNTAVKIRLYDPTDANHQEILTLYAFANDLDNLYIDFAGKNVKLPHNLESNLLEEGAVGKTIADFLNKQQIKLGGVDRSINDIINLVTGAFGNDWNLNSLIDSVLNIVGYDANKIIELISGFGADSMILPALGVNSWDELLNNGKLDILKILTIDALDATLELKATSQKLASGATVHKADISKLVNLATAFIPEIGTDISDMLTKVISAQSTQLGEVALIFSEKNGEIEDLTLYAQLLGLEQTFSDTLRLVPELTVKITDFSIEALAADKSNGVALKTEKANYSDTVAFNETLELAASGIKINKLNADGADIFLNGKIIVNAKGQLDIVNTKAVIADPDNGITENKTKANITVQLVNGTSAPVTLAQVSYANGKIAGKVLVDGIDLGIIDPEWEGKTAFVYDLGANFNVADIVQDNIAKFIDGLFKKGNDGDTSADKEIPPVALTLTQKINRVLSHALPMLSTPDNHLHIEVANILQAVVNFKEDVNNGSNLTKWTVENRTEAIVNALLNPPYPEATLAECIEILDQQLAIIGGDEELTEDEMIEAFNTCKDAGLRILYLVAQNVRIDGVKTEGLKASDYAAFKKNGEDAITDADTELMIYINNIKAVLAAQITIDGDLQDGIHSSITVNIAGATLSASTSFELVENAEFVDLYKEYEKASATDKENWLYILHNEQQA